MKYITNTYHKTLSFSDIGANIESGEIMNVPNSIANYMLVNPFIKLVNTSKNKARLNKKGK